MLTRWDPFHEMMNLRNVVDRLFDNTFSSPGSWSAGAVWGLALDVVENNDAFLVKVSIPGINPDDLDITYTDNTLTIKGEIKEDQERKDSQYHVRERRYGAFSRSISLPSKVKSDAIEANYQAGVLTLKLPKTEEVKPKRIAIKTSEPKVIEAKVSGKK